MAVSDVINQIKATIIPNGVGAITAPVLSSVLLAICALFSTPLGGDANGTFPTITINNGAITAAKMATGAAATNLGFSPYNPAAGGSLGGAVSSTISVTSPTVSASAALQGPTATFAALTAAVKPAGSQALCSDCLKSGQLSGTGTGVAVFSDGTAWFYASGAPMSATAPPRGPVATYTALTAAVLPAGTQVFCSDCLKSGQTTGAGTGMPAFSDGTAWFYAAGTAITH